MLFNSFEFIFFFLPITLLIFFWIGKRSHHQVAISWLVLCSLFFYGWWNPAYLALILFSMLFNYAFGVMLGNGRDQRTNKVLLVLGVAVNLGLLGYYKYASFFVDQINWALGSNFHIEKILLPLAISFFTFQQVAYLVDAYRQETKEYNFLHYCLFVTFFPQLIAGPIVHHKEMLPQFAKNAIYKFNYEHIAMGITIFLIGLFKKVIFADGVAIYATPVFNAAEVEVALTFFEAWGGTIAYTLQLYFDFSGYSDMAIGIAYMFGIKLPINFNSPYKATSIIDFWRRWHITLSRFLREYLYIALGGNRKGNIRRYINLFTTMLLGGIWHGAGWTFVIWGMLHGVYLIINHAWRKIRSDVLKWSDYISYFEIIAARVLTLFAIIIGWVYFRADSLNGANHLMLTMFGFNGISLPSSLQDNFGELAIQLQQFGFVFKGMFGGSYADFGDGIKWIILLLFTAVVMPNTQQLVLSNHFNFRALIIKSPYISGLVSGAVFFYVFINLRAEAEFLYFNF